MTVAPLQRRLARAQKPQRASLVDYLLVKIGQGLPGIEHTRIKAGMSQRALGAKQNSSRPVHNVFGGQTRKLRLLGVYQQDCSVGTNGAHQSWQAVDNLPQTLAGVAQITFALAPGAGAILHKMGELRSALAQQNRVLVQFEQIAGAGDKFIMIDRRMQKIGRARLKRAQAKQTFFVNCDHDGGNIVGAGNLPEAPDEFRAVKMRHPVIGDDEIGRIGLQPFERLTRIAKRAHANLGLDGSRKFGKDIPVCNPIIDDDDERHMTLIRQTRRRWRARRNVRACEGSLILIKH